jgi:hypothetical protein
MNLSMHRPIRRDEMIIEPGGTVRSLGMAADSTSNPCNDCNKREWCIEKRAACEAYRSYTWKHYAKAEELAMLPRVPSKAIFNQIYRGE